MKLTPFIAGALGGAVISALIHLTFFRPPFPPPGFGGPRPPREMEHMFIERFSHDLDLSPDQMQTIRPILSRLHREMLTLKVSQNAAAQKLLSQADAELAPLLNDKQKQRLAEEHKHMEQRQKEEEDFLRRAEPAE